MLAECIYSLQETCYRFKDINTLKGKRWKHLHASSNPMSAEVAILKSDKIDSETKIITEKKKNI